MTEPEHPSFRQRRLRADERVRRRNLEERGNVVPLRRPAPKRAFRLPALPTSPVVLWGAILAILIVVYLVQRVL